MYTLVIPILQASESTCFPLARVPVRFRFSILALFLCVVKVSLDLSLVDLFVSSKTGNEGIHVLLVKEVHFPLS